MRTNLLDAPTLEYLEQAEALSEQARELWLDNQSRQAELLWLKALEMHEQVLGPEHQSLIPILRGLGNALMAQGQAPSAEVFYRRALWIRERRDGWWHHGMSEALYDLAHSCSAQKRYAEAEALYQRALMIPAESQRPYTHEGTDRVYILESYARLPTLTKVVRESLLREARRQRAITEEKIESMRRARGA